MSPLINAAATTYGEARDGTETQLGCRSAAGATCVHRGSISQPCCFVVVVDVLLHHACQPHLHFIESGRMSVEALLNELILKKRTYAALRFEGISNCTIAPFFNILANMSH